MPISDVDLMKNCPVCRKEVPARWSVCEFCGNVFDVKKRKDEPPGMLFWGDSKRDG